MVDRLDKVDRVEPWQVQEAAQPKKEDSQKDHDGGKDAFAALHERTDWKLLFEKSRLWKKNIQVSRDEIDTVTYVKINLKTDPSLLRVDILLKGGSKISPAFTSVSRMIGLKIKNLKAGDPIPEDYILKDNILRITVPADPSLFAAEPKNPPDSKKIASPEEPTVIERGNVRKKFWGVPTPFSIEIWMIMAMSVVFTVLLLIGFFFFF